MQDGRGPRSPLKESEQEYPEPERPLNPQEQAGQSIQELEEPPQAEGERSKAEEDATED